VLVTLSGAEGDSGVVAVWVADLVAHCGPLVSVGLSGGEGGCSVFGRGLRSGGLAGACGCLGEGSRPGGWRGADPVAGIGLMEGLGRGVVGSCGGVLA